MNIPRPPELMGVVLEGVKMVSDPNCHQHWIAPAYAQEMTVSTRDLTHVAGWDSLVAPQPWDRKGFPFCVSQPTFLRQGKTGGWVTLPQRKRGPAWTELQTFI